MLIIKLAIFSILTIGNLWLLSRIIKVNLAHGFYRFFAWEAILILILLNNDAWFHDPFGFRQILSWFLLIVSLIVVSLGFYLLKTAGKPDPKRKDPSLVGIEKTTQLITSGIFSYIRHPLYGSLVYFTWGVFLKDPSIASVSLAVVASIFLYVTAKIEEIENLAFFGQAYRDYMDKTKMFIPYIF